MNLGKIAVLKPDHFGDLILASPAIRVMRERLGEFDLFVSSSTTRLARFLFGSDQAIQNIDFPHLSKTGIPILDDSKLKGYNTIISLRNDDVINVENLRLLADKVFVVPDNVADNETQIQRALIRKIVGDYNPLDYFYASLNQNLRQHGLRKKVGLCISSGHSSNSWPLINWMSLANALAQNGFKVVLIGGPEEEKDLEVLRRLLGLSEEDVHKGGADFSAFLAGLDKVDLVVGTDSGTAHLCSLVRPVVSLFGPSPAWRYAPVGEKNAVLSLRLNCSPCLQFSKTHINLCISRECMNSISVGMVLSEIVKFYKNENRQ